MAYLYDGIATTQRGKVIYRRKPHPFGSKDLRRIIKKIGLPSGSEERFFFILAALDLLNSVRLINHAEVANDANALIGTLNVYVSSHPEFAGFGGGTFGGAGATGTFWRPLVP